MPAGIGCLQRLTLIYSPFSAAWLACSRASRSSSFLASWPTGLRASSGRPACRRVFPMAVQQFWDSSHRTMQTRLGIERDPNARRSDRLVTREIPVIKQVQFLFDSRELSVSCRGVLSRRRRTEACASATVIYRTNTWESNRGRLHNSSVTSFLPSWLSSLGGSFILPLLPIRPIP